MRSLEVKRKIEEKLSSLPLVSGDFESRIIIEEITGKPYNPFDDIDDKSIEKIEEVLEERIKKRKPLAYIFKKWWFYDIEIYIEEGVFIPRRESEVLVDVAIELLKGRKAIFIDFGTGSGALALSILKHNENALGIGIDCSRKALMISKLNGERLSLSQRLLLVEADSLAPIKERTVELIISNPPYVREDEIKELPPEVKNWEPVEALAGGRSGLDTIKMLLKEGKKVLKKGGYIITEVGYSTYNETLELFKDFLVDVSSKRDLNGIPRVVWGRKG